MIYHITHLLTKPSGCVMGLFAIVEHIWLSNILN